jgi:hypothetical protein
MKECKYKDHEGERLLPKSEFRKLAAAKDGLARQCKTCADKISNEWYIKNKTRRQDSQKIRVAKNLLEYRRWKSEIGCKFCDEDEGICLDLHHLDPNEKDINLSDAISRGWCKDSWMKEAEKCVVVCANCHRKIHANIIGI